MLATKEHKANYIHRNWLVVEIGALIAVAVFPHSSKRALGRQDVWKRGTCIRRVEVLSLYGE
jgi:hypothetical protein